MKVVLFFPKVGLPEKWFKLPLSMMAMVKPLKAAGHEVVVLDGHLHDHKRLAQECATAGVVGLSSMTGYQIKHALEAARIVRDTNPAARIIWGGYHVSAMPHQSLEHPLVDAVVVGRGDVVFPKMIDHPDMVVVDGGRIGPEVEIDYSSVNIEDYIGPDLGTRTLSYCSSVGCPGKCGFCAISGPWKGIGGVALADDVEQLARTYGLNAVRFDDGNFFASPSRVEAFCRRLLQKDIRIQWSAFARADQWSKMSNQYLTLLTMSGFKEVAIGGESGSNRVLEMINKGATVEQFLVAADKCKNHGITLLASWVVGFPGETEDEIIQTILLVEKLRERNLEQMLYFYTPWPGTVMWDEAVACGVKYPETLDGWANWRLEDSHLPWLSRSITKDIERLAKELRTERFYLRAARVSSQMRGLLGRALFEVALTRIQTKCFAFPIEMKLFLALQGRGKFLSKLVARKEAT